MKKTIAACVLFIATLLNADENVVTLKMPKSYLEWIVDDSELRHPPEAVYFILKGKNKELDDMFYTTYILNPAVDKTLDKVKALLDEKNKKSN